MTPEEIKEFHRLQLLDLSTFGVLETVLYSGAKEYPALHRKLWDGKQAWFAALWETEGPIMEVLTTWG